MKKIFLYIIPALLLSSCGRKTIEEQLADAAIEFTEKQCPKAIDDFTTIDSMTFDMPSRTIHYYYTLKGDLDDKEIFTSSVVEDFQEKVLLQLRGDLGLKKEKEAKINFGYHYFSEQKGEEFMSFLFTEEDYTGKMTPRSFNYHETKILREYSQAHYPLRQDSCTVIDSLWYDSISRTIYYDYTVNGMLDNDSIYNDPAIKNAMTKSLIQIIKEDDSKTIERDKEKLDFAVRYYSNSTKKLLLQVHIKNEKLR